MSGPGVTRREAFDAIRRVVDYRPILSATVVGLSCIAAVLGGVGLGFIVPIVDLARESNVETAGGLTGLFVRTYNLLGIPLTLETAIAGVGAILTLQYGLWFVVEYYKNVLRAGYVEHLRSRATGAALDARTAYYDEHGADEILNAIVTQSNYAGGFISNGVDLLQAVLVSIVYGAIAFYLAPELTLLTLAVLALLAGIVRWVLDSGYEVGDEVARANERVQSTVQASTTGIRDVKLFGMADELYEQTETAIRRHAEALVELGRNRALFRQLYQWASAVTVFALLYLGLAVFGLPLSRLAAFLFAMFRLSPQLSTINDVFYRAEGDLPHVIRTEQFVQEMEQYAEPEASDPLPVPDPVERVKFDGVSFAYGEEPVLDDVSFSFRRGDFVALVGKSGAGKSTVAALLARLYEPDQGSILVDGTPLEQFAIDEWRARVSVVQQDPHVFNETLGYNLTLGDRDASRQEIEKVAELARVTEFLDDLPNGYDTELGDDGVRLSGGQRQRVAIARALLKDADLLILDEATSDLDTGLEEEVHTAIESMDRDFAVVTIAHRLSTVIEADTIYTFADGRIVESGHHQELIRSDGPYASLYARQAASNNQLPADGDP